MRRHPCAWCSQLVPEDLTGLQNLQTLTLHSNKLCNLAPLVSGPPGCLSVVVIQCPSVKDSLPTRFVVQVSVLCQLPSLRSLTLAGNPAAKLASYQSQVLAALTQLTSLDGSVLLKPNSEGHLRQAVYEPDLSASPLFPPTASRTDQEQAGSACALVETNSLCRPAVKPTEERREVPQSVADAKHAPVAAEHGSQLALVR